MTFFLHTIEMKIDRVGGGSMEAVTKTDRKWKMLRFIIFSLLLAAAAICSGLLALIIYAKVLGPPPLAVPKSTLYYADDGTVIGESSKGGKRYWVKLDDVSPFAVDAVLAIEDKTFYSHYGFDARRIGGAVLANVKAMKKVQGASTITQQYARNLFLTMDKTWKRKIAEAFYTVRLEMAYSKREIMEGYINTISYGHGAFGIEAASEYYFGKRAAELSLAEASMLAGIPKGPGIYSPLVSYDKAKKRQLVILQEMLEDGFITKQEKEQAASEKLRFTGTFPKQDDAMAPYFLDAVRKQLRGKAGLDERTIELGGLKVYTTLNVKHQSIAEEVIREAIPDSSDIQAGFAAADPATGHVTALVGGRDYEKSPFNRAVQAVRQPGSTIKPLLYYAALERGFTPVTMMRSEKTDFKLEDGRTVYSPHNFNNVYAGSEVTMAQALAVSDNIYAVKTHLFLGEKTLAETAKRFGITTKMEPVPSLALGSSGVKVVELVNAYGMLANGGKRIEPVYITRVEDVSGNILYEEKSRFEQVLDPDLTFVMSSMMTGMFDSKLSGYASVTGASIAGQMSRMYAGKSGSTQSDSWMAGFTPALSAGVWTGYDKGKEITLTADKLYAKNIWIRFMERALEDTQAGKKNFKPTKGVTAIPIDPQTGKMATYACPVFRLMYFAKGTEPEDYCLDHMDPGQTGTPQLPPRHSEKRKNQWFHRIFGR